MKIWRRGPFLVWTALTVVAHSLHAAEAHESFKLIVDPDLRVSHDGSDAHMEAPVAASATDPNLLYAAAAMRIRGQSYQFSGLRAYVSDDGGAEWRMVMLPGDGGLNGWDNALVAGKGSKAYLITNNTIDYFSPAFARVRWGLANGIGLMLYRTEDGGRSWQMTAPLDGGVHWDREYAAVDNTEGKYSGRIYIAGSSSNHVMLIYSKDGGRTFSQRIPVCDGPRALTDQGPAVMSDGVLAVSCSSPSPLLRDWGIAVSRDGGETFSKFKPFGFTSLSLGMNRVFASTDTRAEFSRYSRDRSSDVFIHGMARNYVALAASTKASRYPSRLYVTWVSRDAIDRQIIYFAHSDNYGDTWSLPRAVDQLALVPGATALQASPMLTVNIHGVVGIAWFDGRADASGLGYDVYFSASRDGGETFIPAVRVSSKTSYPSNRINATPSPRVLTIPKGTMLFGGSNLHDVSAIDFASPYQSRPFGGDYSAMTADAAGWFHPLWPDAREGAFQLYTSTIRMLSDSDLRKLHEPKSAPAPCELNDDIHLVFEEADWNPARKEAVIPVRLANLSKEIFVSPLVVSVSSPQGPQCAHCPSDQKNPLIFDSEKRDYSLSTAITYAVDAERPLFPGGVTNSVSWRLRVNSIEEVRAFNLVFSVRGYTSQSCRQ